MGGMSRSLYLFMRVTKQTVIITEAGRSHNIKTENISFEKVEKFTCLGTILTYQNYFHQNTKNKLKSGNAYCHSMQNRLSYIFYSKI